MNLFVCNSRDHGRDRTGRNYESESEESDSGDARRNVKSTVSIKVIVVLDKSGQDWKKFLFWYDKQIKVNANKIYSVTDLVKPYDDIDLGQHWPR